MEATLITSVYQFRDPVLFLKHAFEQRKKLNPEFTLRKWSGEMGFESAEILADVFARKRNLRLKWVENIEKAIPIDPSEKTYFQTLILLSNSKNEDEKKVLETLLREISRGNDTQVIRGNSSELFSNWVNMAILSFCKVRVKPIHRSDILQAFSSRVSEEGLNSSIERLLEEGLLLEAGDGSYTRLGTSYSGKTEVSNEGAREYYRQVSDLAKDASKLDPMEREFQCFSMAMDSQKLDEAKALIRNLRNKLSALCDENANQVFQVNLQFFPLVEAVESVVVTDPESRITQPIYNLG